ncbi:MAG: 1-deoxy-D-xylulose-5-phosphate reductoisomerase [Oscillospiraceae bacterium]|nr:1-deoxy-D-xylulose-5-phosphate reductoisomerase [Oscillospiraceae bacterium]
MDFLPVSVLGSTGSIGTQTLDVCRRLGIPVVALCANKSIDLLEAQAREFQPLLVAVTDKTAGETLKMRLSDTPCRVIIGEEAAQEAAALPQAGVVVTAMVGTSGLLPTMAAIREGKRIALSNKETLVCAGSLVMAAAKEHGAEIIPVDSEHSAIFQSMDNKAGIRPTGLKLTASGGPFRGMSWDEVRLLPPERALKHPNWSMGAKVTIDSASMMNKGLELIEAMHLFQMKPESIEILVHPQSIVHSAVEYADGSVIAELGVPDMRLPIQYALTYPERMVCPVQPLKLAQLGSLTFESPNLNTFRCLGLAMKAAGQGMSACCVMNAANEIAVGLYLKGQLTFGGIYETVAAVMERLSKHQAGSLEDVLALDREARREAAAVSAVG